MTERTKKTKPELDEQQIELIQEISCDAIENNLYFCFTYFENDDLRMMIGKVHYVDLYRGELRLMSKQDEVHRLQFKNLLDVRVN